MAHKMNIGPAGRLFAACIEAYSQVSVSETTNEGSNRSLLQNEAARFDIWGSGFGADHGGLDELLDGIPDLSRPCMTILGSIGHVFTDHFFHAGPQIATANRGLLQNLKTILEEIELQTPEILEYHYEKQEDDQEAIEELESLNDCLFDLVPALQRAATLSTKSKTPPPLVPSESLLEQLVDDEVLGSSGKGKGRRDSSVDRWEAGRSSGDSGDWNSPFQKRDISENEIWLGQPEKKRKRLDAQFLTPKPRKYPARGVKWGTVLTPKYGCPYYKYDPTEYWECGRWGLEIGEIENHFRGNHPWPGIRQCSRCGIYITGSSNNGPDLTKHEMTCMSDVQLTASLRGLPQLSLSDLRWVEIYQTLFPESDMPSPYWLAPGPPEPPMSSMKHALKDFSQLLSDRKFSSKPPKPAIQRPIHIPRSLSQILTDYTEFLQSHLLVLSPELLPSLSREGMSFFETLDSVTPETHISFEMEYLVLEKYTKFLEPKLQFLSPDLLSELSRKYDFIRSYHRSSLPKTVGGQDKATGHGDNTIHHSPKKSPVGQVSKTSGPSRNPGESLHRQKISRLSYTPHINDPSPPSDMYSSDTDDSDSKI